MDNTEAFKVSVIENLLRFEVSVESYFDASPAADVCFAFVPFNAAGLFSYWSFCCIII